MKAYQSNYLFSLLATTAFWLVVTTIACLSQPTEPKFNDIAHLSKVKSALNTQINNTFPNRNCQIPVRIETRCILGKLSYAMSVFYISEFRQQIEEANEELSFVISNIPKLPGYSGRSRTHLDGRVDSAYDFHFLEGPMLYRIVKLFGTKGTKNQHLRPDLEDKIISLFNDYAYANCVELPHDQIFHIIGSENHWLMRLETCVANFDLTNRENSKFLPSSGITNKWENYLTSLIEAYLKKGGLIEYFSSTYAFYSLGVMYDIFDFGSTARIRGLAKDLLDVWWTEWAQEQISGFHTGSRAREFLKNDQIGFTGEGLAWLYFDKGKLDRSILKPSLMSALTSQYRPHHVSREISDLGGNVEFSAVSTRLGILSRPSTDGNYIIDGGKIGACRYYFRKDKVGMGSAWAEDVNEREIANISDQSRIAVATLDDDPFAYMFITTSQSGEKNYNDVAFVQHNGTLYASANRKPVGSAVNNLFIYFVGNIGLLESSDGIGSEGGNGYIFSYIPGGYTKQVLRNNIQRVKITDPNGMIIIQLGSKFDFKSLSDFVSNAKQRIFANDVKSLSVRDLHDGKILSALKGISSVFTLDGTEYNPCKNTVYKSPFLNQTRGSPIINLYGTKSKTLIVID